jgi:hypothetical protein
MRADPSATIASLAGEIKTAESIWNGLASHWAFHGSLTAEEDVRADQHLNAVEGHMQDTVSFEV